jgi:hypothetical protein
MGNENLLSVFIRCTEWVFLGMACDDEPELPSERFRRSVGIWIELEIRTEGGFTAGMHEIGGLI